MKILYLDTSSSFLYCGLIQDNHVIFSIKKQLGKDMSKDTLFEISNEFKENSIDSKSIDKIILVNGPGSFTGVRIGITIAKTYAWSLKIPVVVISSLYAMALSNHIKCDYLIPIIDARRGYCYSAIYDNNYNIVMPEQYLKLDILKSKIECLSNNYIVISNDIFDFEYTEYNPDILKIVNYSIDIPPIKNVDLITANYLKLTEAEEKFNDTVN